MSTYQHFDVPILDATHTLDDCPWRGVTLGANALGNVVSTAAQRAARSAVVLRWHNHDLDVAPSQSQRAVAGALLNPVPGRGQWCYLKVDGGLTAFSVGDNPSPIGLLIGELNPSTNNNGNAATCTLLSSYHYPPSFFFDTSGGRDADTVNNYRYCWRLRRETDMPIFVGLYVSGVPGSVDLNHLYGTVTYHVYDQAPPVYTPTQTF